MDNKLRKKIEELAPDYNKSEIARLLKVNINTVSWYCHKYGIKFSRKRFKTVELIKQIEELAPTHTAKMIAEKLGINKNTLHSNMRLAGIKPITKKRLPKEKTATIYADKVLELREKAYNHCKKKGYAQDADDFAQWACEKALMGKYTYNMRYLFIDYLREVKGRTEYAELGSIEQQNKLAHNYSRDRISGTEAQTDDGFIDLATPATQEKEQSLFQQIRFKDKLTKAYFVLTTKYGFTSKEVAEVFGVHESYISAVLQKETERLKEEYKNKGKK